MRRPESVFAHLSNGDVRAMHSGSGEWTLPGYRLTVEPEQRNNEAELPIGLIASEQGLVSIRIRWQGTSGADALFIGDDWERAYGDLEWRGMIPNRVMPWYFFMLETGHISAYGVKTQPAAFCFWQRDASGITLTVDIKNGGNAADLRGRNLTLCTIVQQFTDADSSFHTAARRFCSRMSPTPRLPPEPLFGANDWNYAYGKNTADGILRDADLIASLAPKASPKPYIVIDDGWQDPNRFPDMERLAEEIRGRKLRPGIWVRPLRPSKSSPVSLLLPSIRFGRTAAAPAYDPTIPEALECIGEAVAKPVSWQYSFIKHDFSTYELFGRWGSQMGNQISNGGWSFNDRTKTNAEVVSALYAEIRRSASKDTVILGCNTIGHIAAGIFESQRIGDDTSGISWERTRRMGVNALAHRIAQHGTFSHIDPDCVGVTRDVGWRETRDWMDLVARSGGSLFLSVCPGAVTPETKSAMKEAMAQVIEQAGAYPAEPTSSTTPQQWVIGRGGSQLKTYDWTPNGASPSATV
jgi:alpha-galactosidase